MADSGRVFGKWILVTPAEYSAIVKACGEAGLMPGDGDGGKKLGEVMTPILGPIFGMPFTWSVLVVKPNGEPHEIPGTDKVAITPAWDKTSIYVLPKEASFPTGYCAYTRRGLMKISFKCDKDPMLAEYYDKKFRSQFEEDIEETGMDALQLMAVWTPQMMDEALIQEHWDFELVGEPTDPARTGVTSVQKRKPVLGDDGRPMLLWPSIVFE